MGIACRTVRFTAFSWLMVPDMSALICGLGMRVAKRVIPVSALLVRVGWIPLVVYDYARSRWQVLTSYSILKDYVVDCTLPGISPHL